MVVKSELPTCKHCKRRSWPSCLLDERADRGRHADLHATSGTNFSRRHYRVISNMKAWKPDFCIVVPRTVVPAGQQVPANTPQRGIPVVVITDDVTTNRNGKESRQASRLHYHEGDSILCPRESSIPSRWQTTTQPRQVLALTGAFEMQKDSTSHRPIKPARRACPRTPQDRHDQPTSVDGEFTNPSIAKAARLREHALLLW